MEIEKFITADIRKQIVDEIKRDLTAQVWAMFDKNQIAAEIKNAVVREVQREVADRVMEKYKSKEILDKALSTIQSRLNHKIHTMLSSGIVIKFDSMDEA